MNNLLTSSNLDYHANTTHLSSSAMKLILKDPAAYYAQYIAKTAKNETKDVFSEGSMVHTLLLEPEKVITDYAIYPGMRKAGAAFDTFKAENANKTILSLPQMLRCEALAKSAAAVPLVTELLADSLKEHTMLSTILGTPVKARADAINIEKRYIVDVKTTSLETDVDLFKGAVTEYCYDLSASLYCQIAHDNYGDLFDFYFVVLSKADKGVGIYKASSETLSKGAAAVTSAIVKYKKCLAANDWSNEACKPKLLTDVEIMEV